MLTEDLCFHLFSCVSNNDQIVPYIYVLIFKLMHSINVKDKSYSSKERVAISLYKNVEIGRRISRTLFAKPLFLMDTTRCESPLFISNIFVQVF